NLLHRKRADLMKVSLFVTCLAEMFYQDVAKDTVEVLERLGCEVEFPRGQICCGQPAFNGGYRKDAEKAAKQMISSLEDSEFIVTPSGSCAAMVKEYPRMFEEDRQWQERAERVAD